MKLQSLLQISHASAFSDYPPSNLRVDMEQTTKDLEALFPKEVRNFLRDIVDVNTAFNAVQAKKLRERQSVCISIKASKSN